MAYGDEAPFDEWNAIREGQWQREQREAETQYASELRFWKERTARAMTYIRAERAFRNCRPSLRRANLYRNYQAALKAMIDAGDLAPEDAGRELEAMS